MCRRLALQGGGGLRGDGALALARAVGRAARDRGQRLGRDEHIQSAEALRRQFQRLGERARAGREHRRDAMLALALAAAVLLALGIKSVRKSASLDRSAVNCLSSAQAELPQSAPLTAPSKRGLKAESSTRQRPIAAGDAANLYRLGMEPSVSHSPGDNASAARRPSRCQSAFPFGGPGTLSFGAPKESASGKLFKEAEKEASRGRPRPEQKTAAKPIIRQFAANKLQYFPTLALSKSGQWVEARASSQPCGSPFGNAIILYRAKFCNRILRRAHGHITTSHNTTQSAPRDYAPEARFFLHNRSGLRPRRSLGRVARGAAGHPGFAAARRFGRAMPQRIRAAPARPRAPRRSCRKTAPRVPALSGLSAQNMPARSALVPRWATGWSVKPKPCRPRPARG